MTETPPNPPSPRCPTAETVTPTRRLYTLLQECRVRLAQTSQAGELVGRLDEEIKRIGEAEELLGRP